MAIRDIGKVTCSKGHNHEIARDNDTGEVYEVLNRGWWSNQPSKLQSLNIRVDNDAKALVVGAEKLKHK